MKKINLDSIKNFLSRDEMRKISGGSGGYCLTNCIYDFQCPYPSCGRCMSVEGLSHGLCMS